MKAYTIAKENGRLKVSASTVAPPAAGPDQLLVKVRAASLNRGELLSVKGEAGKRFGGEVAGEIVAAGENVQGWKVGDPVMGRCSGGGFAELALIDQWEALTIPNGLSFQQAATIPLVFTVAWDMLRWRGGIAQGDAVLIAGVSSGVGVASLLLAKALGGTVLGTSRSQAKLQALLVQGLDVAITSGVDNLDQKVQEQTDGNGVKLAINVVGASVFEDLLCSLAVGGSLATVGYMDGAPPPAIDLARLHERRLSVFGVSNRHRTAAERVELVADLRARVMPFFEDGTIVPIVPHVYPNEALDEAIALMEHDAHTGKIVVTW